MDTRARAEAEAVIALVRAGTVLDPFGRTADELLEEHRSKVAVADGYRLLRGSYGLLRKGVLAELWEAALAFEAPAPELAALAADDEFAARLRALEVQSARLAGQQRALIAEHMQRVLAEQGSSGEAMRELASIAASELRLSIRTIEHRMSDAWLHVTELPAAHEAAAAGRITTSHLRTIEGETRALLHDPEVDAETRARVVDELVAIAEVATPGRVRKAAKRIVDAAMTAPLQQRHDTALERRCVRMYDVGDGMADVVARVPSVYAAGFLDRLRQAALRKSKDDPRTFDQFCADAFLELALTGTVPDDVHGTSGLTAHVTVVVPATALLDDGDDPAATEPFPASLDGRVLVDPETARRLARGASIWERLFTDPVSGVPITADTYRPSPALKRAINARDGGCRFPLCDGGTLRADLDHTRPWAEGGNTTDDNLATVCRPDHVLRHNSRWKVRQLGHGVLEWQNPIGTIIVDRPPPVGPTFTDGPPTEMGPLPY